MGRAAKKDRIKAAAAPGAVFTTLDEVVGAIAGIGRLQRERARIEAEMNDRLAAIREEYEGQANPLGQGIKDLFRGVQTWCEAHREELTQGGKTKSVKLASGEVRWRKRASSVVVRGVEAVIERLKKAGLTQFVRVKEEINREAILEDRDLVREVKGITIQSGEDFEVIPYETPLETVVP